jgi:hypothetical protein
MPCAALLKKAGLASEKKDRDFSWLAGFDKFVNRKNQKYRPKHLSKPDRELPFPV